MSDSREAKMFIKTLLFFILSIAICFSSLARDLPAIHKALLSVEKQLSNGINSESNTLLEINKIDFSFAWHQGAQFQIHLTQPLHLWLSQLESNQQNLQNINYVESENNPRDKQSFDQIKLKAKELSHHVYSLERKIKSMNKHKLSLSGEEKLNLEQKIIAYQYELNTLKTQKKILKPQYTLAKKAAKTSGINLENEKLNFFSHFEELIADTMCHSESLTELLLERERVSFTLKQAAELNQGRYQDVVYSFDINAISACSNKTIDEDMFLQHGLKHIF